MSARKGGLGRWIGVGGAIAALVAGCGANPTLLELGIESDAGGVSSGGGSGSGGDSGGALSVVIEDTNRTVLDTAALACTGDCIDVQAVARGSAGPVSYQWSDGASGASRHLCPTSSSTFSVTATEPGAASGELSAAPQTASATLTVSCSDSGASGGDAGPQICIANPTFMGTVFTNVDAPPWVDCAVPAAIVDNTITETATMHYPDAPPPQPPGATYLFLSAQGDPFVAGNANGAVSEPLCEPMHAGTTYSVKVDLALVVANPSTAYLVILGGASSCQAGELLWSSPAPGPTWGTYCASFTPTRDTPYLELAAAPMGDGGAMGGILVANMVPVAACD